MDESQVSCQDIDGNVVVLQEFLEEHHSGDIVRILFQDDSSEHFSVVVNTLELIESTDNQLSHLLLAEPRKMLPLFDQALSRAVTSIMQRHENHDLMAFKPNLHVRLSNLPICPELRRDTLPKSSDVSRFIAITGQ